MLATFEIALLPTGVDAPMLTGTVIAAPLALAAMTVDDVQLTFAPLDPEQFHPVPVGVPLKVNPVGSVSVMVPLVAPVPLLLGVMV
jgi:hypothetical protein